MSRLQQQNLNKLQNISPGLKICMLGFGIENQALVKFLLKNKIKSEITICDARKNLVGTRRGAFLRHKNIKWRLGKNYDKNLKDFDIIFRVPGYPLFKLRRNAPWRVPTIISSPTKLFFELCPTKNIIGVTGTKGKGTTASLIYEILKSRVGTGQCPVPTRNFNVFFGGNIGIAPFEFIDKIKKNDWVVLELSSFQLEDMDVSPKIAVITNFSKEHLAPADPNNPNYHKTLKSYWKAKANIFKWQNKSDYLIINKNFQFSIFNFQSISNLSISNFKKLYHKKYKNKLVFFNKSELKSKLIGDHNKENVAAAIEAAKIVGIKQNIIKKAVAGFKGLEHRIEYVGIKRAATNGTHANKINEGVKYYNDSFATTPESAIIALKSFSNPIILLAGGADKGSSFKQFAKEIKRKIKFVVLLNGKATPKIKKELLKIKYPKDNIKLVYNIKDAVNLANKNAEKGDIVLLSTACASFGMFKNYKERGKLFKKEVKQIKKE